MKQRFFLVFASLLMVAVIGLAQPTTNVTYEMKLATADTAAANYDYYTAIDWFGQAYKESKDPSLQIAIADCYARARDFDRALKIYDRFVTKDRKGDYSFLKIDLANMYKATGEYGLASKYYNEVLVDTALEEDLKMEAKFHLAGINGMDGMADNVEAIIKYLPEAVNSGSAESAPAIGPDGELYFSSFNRKKEIIMDGDQGDYHAKLYSSKINNNGEFDKARALPDIVNREGFNSGGVSFSADGRRMYFTRAKLNNNEVSESQIMFSDRSDRGWGAAAELPKINGNYIAKHPVEGELFGRKVLFFSSNMDGGEGGFDIFYADIDGDVIGSPVNLGAAINTKEDEISPFYLNGTLYFSSLGHPGIGGYDLFFSQWDGSNWGVPANMGFNYNTSYDDMFLRFAQSGTRGYLVSNRPAKDKAKLKGSETCCDDIYSIQIREIVIDLAALVNDDKSKLTGASVELYDLTSKAYPDSKTNMNSNDFNFALEADRKYKAVVAKEGYFPDSIEFNTNGIIDDYTFKKTITLKKDPNWKKESDEIETFSINQPIRLNNIYYDLAKADILPDAELDLNVILDLMNEYSDMKIELSSHTDSRGTAASNQKLSQKRSESARNWLIAQGVAPDRIKPVGYGESLILNRCTDNVKCTEEEHRLNRRTEFKIIEGPTTITIRKSDLKDLGGEKRFQENKKSGKQSMILDSVPVITFDKNNISMGTIYRGEKKEVTFTFVNTGEVDLNIELVTACKCTSITWPMHPVAPGQRGEIKATFDTVDQDLGDIQKTLDIISNTEPLVVEAFFTATIVEPKKGE